MRSIGNEATSAPVSPPVEREDQQTSLSAVEEAASKALAEITKKLGGGGFGDIWIEGSKPTVAKGHLELFEIKRLLEILVAAKAKNSRCACDRDPEPQQANKKPARMNANNTAAMKSVIDTHLERRFRDIEIREQRLEERLDKAERGEKALAEKVESKLMKKKNPDVPSMAQHRALESRVKEVEKTSSETTQHGTELTILERRFNLKPWETDLESYKSLVKSEINLAYKWINQRGASARTFNKYFLRHVRALCNRSGLEALPEPKYEAVDFDDETDLTDYL